MCARVLQLILAAAFVYVAATVAAFVYLDWWLALLVSAATMFVLVFAAKLLIRSFIGRLGNMAKAMFSVKSRVLRGATVEVHAVRPTDVPEDLIRQLNETDASDDDEPDEDRQDTERAVRDYAWYEIEATIFPDPAAAGPMKHWDVDDLKLVPGDTRPPSFDDEDDDTTPEYELHHVRLVADGVAEEPEGSNLHGPRRLRFTAGFPRTLREVTFRYYFEQFGLIRLSSPLRR